jgi:hypothetical protein
VAVKKVVAVKKEVAAVKKEVAAVKKEVTAVKKEVAVKRLHTSCSFVGSGMYFGGPRDKNVRG